MNSTFSDVYDQGLYLIAIRNIMYRQQYCLKYCEKM